MFSLESSNKSRNEETNDNFHTQKSFSCGHRCWDDWHSTCDRIRKSRDHRRYHTREKNDLGGTWRENTYPGVACDIPAHMYTYSFEPNPEWSHRFAHGDEIQAYFKRVSDKYKVTPRIHFNEAVSEASYNNGKWTTKTNQGKTYVSDF